MARLATTILMAAIMVVMLTMKKAMLSPNYAFANHDPAVIFHLQQQATADGKPFRILVYFTTHWSDSHAAYIEFCWPLALQNLKLLEYADITVFSTAPNTTDKTQMKAKLDHAFPGKNMTIYQYDKMEHLESLPRAQRYHRGAKEALSEAGRKGYFQGYDWVIRLNPDVIIQDDTWLLQTMMEDEQAALLWVNCRPQDDNVKVQTDFFALRPSTLPQSALIHTDNIRSSAEYAWTEIVNEHLIETNRSREIPGATTPRVGCRVQNRTGPVFHFHNEVDIVQERKCPAVFHFSKDK